MKIGKKWERKKYYQNTLSLNWNRSNFLMNDKQNIGKRQKCHWVWGKSKFQINDKKISKEFIVKSWNGRVLQIKQNKIGREIMRKKGIP